MASCVISPFLALRVLSSAASSTRFASSSLSGSVSSNAPAAAPADREAPKIPSMPALRICTTAATPRLPRSRGQHGACCAMLLLPSVLLPVWSRPRAQRQWSRSSSRFLCLCLRAPRSVGGAGARSVCGSECHRPQVQWRLHFGEAAPRRFWARPAPTCIKKLLCANRQMGCAGSQGPLLPFLQEGPLHTPSCAPYATPRGGSDRGRIRARH